MASREYRIETTESVPEGIARIARGRIDDAIDQLEGRADSSPEKAVHEARKDMKKLRALMRLVRDEVGASTYRRESGCFRDAGRELSSVRDAAVMLATLRDVQERFPDHLDEAVAGPLRQALEAHKIRTTGGAHGPAGARVVEVLGEARARIARWPLERDGFGALEGGLRRIYRSGRGSLREARRDPTSEALHEWRKRTKDLWYHLTLMRESWPPVLTALADEAHELSDRLGDDHDLAVLLDWTREHAAEAADALAGPVERRRGELQAEAFALGARLYADKPGAYIRRLERWWRAGRGEGVMTPRP
jgi:CHAD domain-containing protein